MLLHLQHFSRRQEEISRDCLQVACSVTGPSVIISEVHELVRAFSLHITLSTYSSLLFLLNGNQLQYKNTQIFVHLQISSRILTAAIQISSVVNGKPEIPGSNYMNISNNG